MTLIQICKSFCTSASVYVIAGVRAGLEAKVDLGARTVPKSRSGELKIAEPNILVSLLLFAVVPLSCMMASLGAESLLGSLEAIKPRERFL